MPKVHWCDYQKWINDEWKIFLCSIKSNNIMWTTWLWVYTSTMVAIAPNSINTQHKCINLIIKNELIINGTSSCVVLNQSLSLLKQTMPHQQNIHINHPCSLIMWCKNSYHQSWNPKTTQTQYNWNCVHTKSNSNNEIKMLKTQFFVIKHESWQPL